MKKLLSLIIAAVMLFAVAALAEENADQVGSYVLYNLTGENVVSVTITDNVSGETTEVALPETDGKAVLAPDAFMTVTYSIPAGEDGHGRLTLTFTTEGGYVGTFATLSIEVAPISLLAKDALTGATQISFTAPKQTGTYKVYNVTGETVTELTITDNVTGKATENLVPEGGLADKAWMEVNYSIDLAEDGHHRLTLAFTTESGYKGSFDTLSIEVAPISLLAKDALTGATQISFKAAQNVGVYTIYNVTGETVTELTLTDNVTGVASANLVPEGGLAAGASIDISQSLDMAEDGHGRLTLAFTTESGYQGSFATLSIEVAPISLLSQDGMTGATQISFKAPAAE